MEKILERWQVGLRVRDYRKVVATNGCFDILHIGHKRLLESARELGDVLIVAVNDDESVRSIKGKPRPLIPAEERAEMLAAFSFVDYVTVFHGRTAEDIMSVIKPAVFVKGDNVDKDEIPERHVVEEHGGEVILLPITRHVKTDAIISALEPGSETKHLNYTLWDRYDKVFLDSQEVSKEHLVVTADGRVLHYRAGVTQRDGQAYADPVLIPIDMSYRYDVCIKAATG